MEEKQRRQRPNLSSMSSNDGPSFGAGAGAVREETVTPEEYRAIERVSFSFFPGNVVF